LLRQLAREPLVHFLLLGVLLFAARSCIGPLAAARPEHDAIVIDQARLDHLEMLWKAQWKRDPSPQDVAAIIDRDLRQEVFYREALRMGLDKDDEIVRTRLSQKMEAVASDLSTLMAPPTDEQLHAFYLKRPDLFTVPQSFALQQLLYLPAEAADGTVEKSLAALRAGGEPPTDRLDKLSIPNQWPLTSAQALDNAFGGDFAEALSALPVGAWSGPVPSGLGLHLVRITESRPAHLADFEDIHAFVAQQYAYYAVMDAQQRMFDELRARYEVSISASGVPEAVKQEYASP